MESHNMLSWNVRGINKREKQVSLSKFFFVNKIGHGALLETKLHGDKVGKMMSSFFIGWNYYSSSASEGRLLILWQPQVVTVEILKESDQFVHICVKEVKSNKLFCVTFVYGRNSTEGRLPLWVDLAGLSFPANPWIVAGDFNAVFEGTDRWTDHISFEDTVLKSWNKPIKGAGLVRIVRKLSRLKVVLRKFNKHFVGDVAQNYSLAKDKYQSAQASLQKNPHSKELQREELLAGESFTFHSRAYDSFLRQKSKVDWLRYGDDNTAYFHACLKQRRANNCITSVVTESGQLIEKFDDVVGHFVTHFQKIMGSNSSASVPI
ncbi:uncharacterized protein LOC133832728 [Humulus lupulus]|uniref:uncharacterized protein LOC133832728 n=1 Tax=Humulus lupulus TaxID=3486 RepID=UPI002B4019BA|nr:uncharacterized protein LOC133832728 [Humulus lupulus]